MDRGDFVHTVARGVVAAVAPDELALFEPVSRAYLRDPERVPARRGRPGEVLGSGIDVAVELVSPVALAVADATYDRLVGETGEAAVCGSGGRLDELHALAGERASALGLPGDRAKRVADALRAHLERES
ncbi:hypothetical protein ACFV4N_20110 [Actinosynnema sp. NPDC059797]